MRQQLEKEVTNFKESREEYMKGLEGGNGNKNAVLNYTFILKKKKNTWC